LVGEGASARSSSRALLWLAACLIVEYLLISVLFDAHFLERRLRWLAGIGYVGPLLIAIGTATLLFKGDLPAIASSAGAAERPDSRPWFRWLAHPLLFAAFLELTRRLAGPRASLPGDQLGWFVLWVVVGAASIAALLLTVLPPAAAIALARRAWPTVVLSIAVGGLAWVAGRWAERLWTTLGSLTLSAVAGLLHLGSGDVVSVPERLEVGLRSFHIRVAPVCSGYEGIGLILVFLAACLVAMRKSLRFPVSFLLLPIGVLAAWSANVLRITALIVVGSRWSPELAYGGFHSKAGWILFCCVALGLAALARRPPFSTHGPAHQEGETWNPSAAYLMPFLALGATALVVGLVSQGFQSLYPLRVAAALVPLWIWRRCYGPIRIYFSWTALFLGAIAFVVWAGLQGPEDAARGEELRLGVESLGLAQVPWIVCRIFGSVFVAPVVEELAFRGFLLRRLIGPDFTEVSLRPFNVKAFLLSSFAFGALHQSLWAGTLAGMIYALAQHRRGQTGDAILAHAVTNAILTGGALLGGRWAFWT
jgi:exosortase E/protease (VPEID-CTERM system)